MPSLRLEVSKKACELGNQALVVVEDDDAPVGVGQPRSAATERHGREAAADVGVSGVGRPVDHRQPVGFEERDLRRRRKPTGHAHVAHAQPESLPRNLQRLLRVPPQFRERHFLPPAARKVEPHLVPARLYFTDKGVDHQVVVVVIGRWVEAVKEDEKGGARPVLRQEAHELPHVGRLHPHAWHVVNG